MAASPSANWGTGLVHAQPVDLIAEHAVALMIEQIEEGGVALDRRRVSLQTRLVIRESCGGGPAVPA